jgi:hypothetical protein
MSDKIGVAVSLYDKFDDLGILHDILRHNFEDDYYLSVYCNHPNAEEEIREKRDLDIDHLSTEIEMEYREGPQKTMRILNSIKKSCRSAMENSDNAIHLHADAWVLDESKLKRIIDEMQKKGRKLAFRGRGNTYQEVSGPYLGLTMDQFFVFDSEYFEKTGFFEFDALDPLPHMGIHNSMMILFVGRIGRTKMWRYSDFSEDIWYDGLPTTKYSSCRPSVYNSKWGLFHCARDEFDGLSENYGKEIQANRLKDEKMTKGPHIEKLIKNSSKSREEIIQELSNYEQNLDLRLRLLLDNPKKHGRRFSEKENILNKTSLQKIQLLAKNLFRKAYFGLNNAFFSVAPFEKPARTRDEQQRGSKWPKNTEEVYRDEINTKEIEKNKFWFQEDESSY